MFVEPAAEAQPNYELPFTHRPEVREGWLQLNGAIKASMDTRLYELVTVAAARRLRSSYCSLVHGRVLADQFLGADAVRALVEDPAGAGLDERDAAVVAFAEQVVADATRITQADVDRLREVGLADDEIVSVALAAAARCFFSKTLDALGVLPDASLAEIEPGLRDALVVGRPIAEA